jgi:hypothetical protein
VFFFMKVCERQKYLQFCVEETKSQDCCRCGLSYQMSSKSIPLFTQNMEHVDLLTYRSLLRKLNLQCVQIIENGYFKLNVTYAAAALNG